MISAGHKIMMRICGLLMLLTVALHAWAGDGDFPQRPSPPRLVNDLAEMMNPREQAELEAKLVEFDKTTSTQIAVVTIKSLGSYDASDYAVKLFNQWGIGQKGKNNGVLIFASLNDRKMWITTGRGVEGALTDLQCGQIVRNELRPAFKEGNYYEGFSRAADAVIKATKGEYTADDKGGKKPFPVWATILLIAIVYFVLWILSKMRGGGGGSYMSGRGFGGFGTGWMIGSMMNRGGSDWGGGSSGGWGGGGGGGFGGFGGGSSGGGGAGGSW